MKVIEIGEAGFGLENLQVATRDVPEPGPGQLLLKMTAASLNYRDLMMIRGQYNPRQPLPLIPCSDGVGYVVSVGEGVSTDRIGERRCPLFTEGWYDGDPTAALLARTRGGPIDGTLAEYVVIDQDDGIIPPAHLSDAEAACLPCAALTAWSALVTLGGLRAGQSVLVQGTGGVSLFALQIATLRGARVIATSSRDEKLERVRAMGAVATINYKDDPKWGKAARKLAGGDGVDHVIEVGGAGTLGQSLRAVRPGGHISMIGVLSGGAQPLSVIPILMRQICVQGVFTGHRTSFIAMNDAFSATETRPVVDQIFPFDDINAAFAHMAAGRHFGKIAVHIADAPSNG
ncbi:MAG: NAD(P)-dependent alcohol dehydrogenase [Myxococcota bacterium]